MLAAERLLGLEPAGGVYVPLAGEDRRPRGAVADDVPEVGSGFYGGDRVSRGEFEQALERARERLRETSAAMGRGRAALHAGLVLVPGRLLLPVDLPGGGVTQIDFTEQQRAAIDRRDCSLLVRAGAGTGKTSVLVERFARAVLDDEVEVTSILAITFTEKAAAQLKRRVRERLSGPGRPGGRARGRARVDLDDPWLLLAATSHARAHRRHRSRVQGPRRARGRAAGDRRLRPRSGRLPRRWDRPGTARFRRRLPARRAASDGPHGARVEAEPRRAPPGAR